MITKLPTFVKEPVSAVEWFNREKINEIIEVVNKLDANLKDVSKCATKDIQGIMERLDKLEKHKHNFDTDDIELYTQIETSEPISYNEPDWKGFIKDCNKEIERQIDIAKLEAVIKGVYEIARAYSSDDGKAATNRIVDKLKPYISEK
jgi:hypothetical protein